VFVTNHSQYENLRPKDLLGRHGRAIVDTRNLFNAGAVEKAGLVYKGIGK
jgi:UDP-N-acetyl-D-mannosaminuronate dehydrogenase